MAYIREYPPGFFLKLSPLTPLQKGLNLGEKPNPFFHLLKFFCVFVIQSESDLKQWAAAKQQMYKKIKILQKLTQLQAKRDFFCPHSFRHHGTDQIAKEFRKLKRQIPHIFSAQPRVGSDIRANFITGYSVYLLADDPEMSQLMFKHEAPVKF